jgi:hypothetical protein
MQRAHANLITLSLRWDHSYTHCCRTPYLTRISLNRQCRAKTWRVDYFQCLQQDFVYTDTWAVLVQIDTYGENSWTRNAKNHSSLLTDELMGQIIPNAAFRLALEALITAWLDWHPINGHESLMCRRESSGTRTIQQNKENGEKFSHCR